MEALFYSLEVFYKHVGCSNAELFKEVSSFVSSIGEMLVNNVPRRYFYVRRPEAREFMEFIDGNGFKVTCESDSLYIVEII